MDTILKVQHQIENPTPSIHAYFLDSPAKFHPDPIWMDRAFGFFEEVNPRKKEEEKQQQKQQVE